MELRPPHPSKVAMLVLLRGLDEIARRRVAGRLGDVTRRSQINMLFTGLFAGSYPRCCRRQAFFYIPSNTYVQPWMLSGRLAGVRLRWPVNRYLKELRRAPACQSGFPSSLRANLPPSGRYCV